LTQILVPVLKEGEGNVHSGATPPWMLDTTGNTIPTVPNILTDAERLDSVALHQIESFYCVLTNSLQG
jgi:hypothetical protein